jgi:hypothetical protein
MAELAEQVCRFSRLIADAPEPRPVECSGTITGMSGTPRPDQATKPVCQFFRMIPDAPDPQPADRSADGTLPVNALRYCEPVAAASGFGWHLYPPLNFSLIWSGDEVAFALGRSRKFSSLRGLQYPGFKKTFADLAPEGLKELAPPLLVQGLLPGVVQIWSGYFAKTAPGWALLSRGVANRPKTQPYENFEGIVETDTWFGPLFTNIRLTRTNSRIEFHKRYPLFQAQPLRRECYLKPPFELMEAADLSSEDWDRFAATVKPNTDQMRKAGHYAVDTRKRLRSQS